ncbi:hypothetical protein EVAR_41275_1 [Eumeta japonica]|uniref:Uncharacterized protein n=1 Tax=Eumeta variegata TaxID=151549 RepID=A0A4C1XA07_EUMVA|nr:hypothetical protein EVAR_41275_1 [Eumeta japonica]
MRRTPPRDRLPADDPNTCTATAPRDSAQRVVNCASHRSHATRVARRPDKAGHGCSAYLSKCPANLTGLSPAIRFGDLATLHVTMRIFVTPLPKLSARPVGDIRTIAHAARARPARRTPRPADRSIASLGRSRAVSEHTALE